jgi:hypothetical protein
MTICSAACSETMPGMQKKKFHEIIAMKTCGVLSDKGKIKTLSR